MARMLALSLWRTCLFRSREALRPNRISDTGNTITRPKERQVLGMSGKTKRVIPKLCAGLLLLTVVGLLACGGDGSSTGQPRIHFDQDFIDVGIVPPGVSLDYAFHFTNEGDAPLIIRDATIQVLEGC